MASFIPATAGVAWAYRGYKLARGGIYVAKTLSGAKYVGQSGKVGVKSRLASIFHDGPDRGLSAPVVSMLV